MKLVTARAPNSTRFGFWTSNANTRDLGDFVLWILGWQITIWFRKPIKHAWIEQARK